MLEDSFLSNLLDVYFLRYENITSMNFILKKIKKKLN